TLAVGVRTLLRLVPAGDRDDSSFQPLVEFDCVVGHIAEALDGGLSILGPHAQFFERLAQCNDDAIAGSLGSAERATHADGLAGDEAGKTAAVDLLKLIEHRADIPCHLAHPATANLLLLSCAKIVRITDHSTLRPAERNIHHCALPRHPHG